MAALSRKQRNLADLAALLNPHVLRELRAREDAAREKAWVGVSRSEVEACPHCWYPRRSYAWAWQDRPHCDGRCREKR